MSVIVRYSHTPTNKVTTDLGNNIVVFNNPTVTLSHTNVYAQDKRKIVAVRRMLTVRALLYGTTAVELNTQINRYQKILESPAGYLYYAIPDNNKPICQFAPTSDMQFGPKPSNFQIQRMFGGRCAMIIWQIESLQPPVKWAGDGQHEQWENRWQVIDFMYSLRHTVDQHMYTHRVISGVLQLAIPQIENALGISAEEGRNNQLIRISADAFRNQVEEHICPLPKDGYWTRVNRAYDLSADGTTLSFEILDRQQFRALPEGCSMADMTLETHAPSREHADTDKVYYTLRGQLQAPPTNTVKNKSPLYKVLDDLLLLIFENYEQASLDYGNDDIGEDDGFNWEDIRVATNLMAHDLSFSIGWSTYRYAAFQAPENDKLLDEPSTYARMAGAFFVAYSKAYTRYPTGITHKPYGTTPLVVGYCGNEIPDPLKLQPDLTKTKPPKGGYVNPGDDKPSGNKEEEEAKGLLYYHMRHEYKTKYGYRFAPVLGQTSEDAGYDIIQKVHRPQTNLVVTGELVSGDLIHAVPPPAAHLYEDDSPYPDDTLTDTWPAAVLLETQITPVAPDAQGLFRLSWRYVYRIWHPKALDNIKYPHSPKAPDKIQQKVMDTNKAGKYYPASLQSSKLSTGEIED
jgi:hypothetical protein